MAHRSGSRALLIPNNGSVPVLRQELFSHVAAPVSGRCSRPLARANVKGNRLLRAPAHS